MLKFELSRWFGGIGAASEEARAWYASPEADARVRKAIDALPVTLFEFDPKGIYTSVAGRYVGMFGITGAQVVGRSVFDFPKFVPGKNMMVRRALAGETVTWTAIWPLGRFTIRLQPRRDANRQVTSVIGLGYEQAKPAASDDQIEQLLDALRQSEARFRAMCESAPLGIYVSNSAFELGYVNPALCAMLGRKPDELLGRHWQTVLAPEERTRLRSTRPAAQLEPGSYADVLRVVRSDGSQLWTALRTAEMRDGTDVLGYVGVITDVTQERSARLAIDRAQQDLRRVIETSPEGIAVVRDGRWIFVNRALVEALGYPQTGHLLGRTVAEIVHPDDLPCALELGAQAGPGPRSGGTRELRYRRASGDYALMEVSPAALTEFDGAPAVLITARDITERKRLQAQLLVSERLLSVGTLAAGVAHEINNPLAAVLSNLDWVAARLAQVHRQASQLDAPALRAELLRIGKPIDEAREAAERVRAIVRDLKLFSRAEEELGGPVELAPVLDSATRMGWNEVRHRARFVREYGELPAVPGSEARLGQVFLNLIINAAQAIPEGRTDEHEIRLAARVVSKTQVVVEVQDTGCGMDAETIGRIFDPFFTTKPPGVGTGLGLAICHRIVSSVGGQIEVESRPGRGSTFRVTLPIADRLGRATAPAPSRPPPEPASDTARGRVLVIDDDAAMGSAIELVLGDQHEVEVLTSARTALARLRDGARYDAIVCDVMMPGMSGVDFHSELTRLQPKLAAQVIFLTGGAFTLGAREFLDRVSNPRLDKPFDSDSLRALVSKQMASG